MQPNYLCKNIYVGHAAVLTVLNSSLCLCSAPWLQAVLCRLSQEAQLLQRWPHTDSLTCEPEHAWAPQPAEAEMRQQLLT